LHFPREPQGFRGIFFYQGFHLSQPKVPIVAIVDSSKVKYSKGNKLGIDFSNEIDIWAKMEFRSRQQVKKLKRDGSLESHEILNDLKSLVYAVREKID
jgi:hypothetical protein